MSQMSPVDQNSDLWKAWERWRTSDDGANSLRHCVNPQHARGSLWAAFMAGWVRSNSAAVVKERPRMTPLGLWHDAVGDEPDRGLEVLLIVEGDEDIRIGWWDKELAGRRAEWVVHGPNGTTQVRALYWMPLPPPPGRK